MALKMSTFVKSFGLAASALGIIQGVVWIILSLISILIYTKAWKPALTAKTYGQLLSAAIVEYYLDADLKGIPSGINITLFVLPLQLFIWAILYLIVHLIWISISSYMLWALQKLQYALIKKIYLAWAVCTGIVCLCDFILTVLLAIDYDTKVGWSNKLVSGSVSYAILANGILMTLAARGFILWIVNVIFVVIVMKLALGLSEKVSNKDFKGRDAINVFDQSNSREGGFNNPAYNYPNFTRSDSFTSTKPQQVAPENLSRLPPISSTNDRLAKIGRQGAKSPPHNIPPPKLPQSYIYPSQPRVPSPDYSPPNSPFPQPQLKSVLKSRTQNAYGFSNNGRY